MYIGIGHWGIDAEGYSQQTAFNLLYFLTQT